ncbi:four helix bundle protein [Nodosilinea sp. E11]|uniref:four helix bundle protein n=1 Tax=Nodosilinea sp. E11 TaxID=3037479 RepID=UPI0029342734|nr:four helix bundle protein [Nodosilinea sp. E11]WOD39737.1 four helix bundle protein [Nodosilinea sp. E11]
MGRGLVRNHEDWEVYQIAFEAAMEIFELTKQFPKEERYSLTDQMRRSSRSVCANLAEAWRKRLYKAAFIAKLSDSAAEAAETQTWLAFSKRCHYLDQATEQRMKQTYDQVLGRLVSLINNADRWVVKGGGVKGEG